MQPKTNLKYKPCEMVLTCILTDDERRARGIEIGACVEKLEESEDEFKAVKSRYDREKKELTGKVRDLSRATRTGEEMRTVNCQKVYDYPNSRVYWIREDLGEVFKERPMHEDEKQFELFKPDEDLEPEETGIPEGASADLLAEDEQGESAGCYVCGKPGHPGKTCEEVDPTLETGKRKSGWTPEEITAKDRRIAEKVQNQG